MNIETAELRAKIDRDGSRPFGPSRVDVYRLCGLYEAEIEQLQVALERISNHYDDTDLAAKHMAAIARAALSVSEADDGA